MTTHFDAIAIKDLRKPNTHNSYVVETIMAPAAAALTGSHAAITGSATVPVVVTTGFTNPGVPRNVTIDPAGTLADVPAGTATVEGTNILNQPISEDFTLVANDGTVIVGVKAFKTVTKVTIPVCDGAAATFAIGYGNVLGLLRKLDGPALLMQVDATSDGTYAADAGTLVIDIDEIEKNTYLPADVPDGTSDYRLIYVTGLP